VDFHLVIFQFPFETLAVSFSTIRIFMTTKQLLGSRREEGVEQSGWIFAAAFFLPALIVGPVFSGTDLRRDARQSGIARPDLLDFRLILQGFVLAALANPALGALGAGILEAAQLPNWTLAPLYFMQLFLAFWGQSLIAEHTSRLFGYNLPQNFDRPWLARDIKDFWSRWHRSMASFIMRYIYLPLSLNGVSPQKATIGAFVFMGLWHNLSIGYAVWGIAHGLLMAFWSPKDSGLIATVSNRVITLGAVITLSYIANFGSLS
jgi:D-alanyl-lipoteichoic acid acyltransferase DltB (MBOAT superfamily)